MHVRHNSTAVSYINNMGGSKSHSLDALSRCLWEWCISRQLHVSAQHLPGAANIIADQLSRTINFRLEWSLNNEVYKSIICRIAITWADPKCYAFPPFSVLPRVLAKILRDQADTELVSSSATSSSGFANIVAQVGASANSSTQSAAASTQAHVGAGRLDVIRNTLSARRLCRVTQSTSCVDPGQLEPKSNTWSLVKMDWLVS